MNHLGKIDVLIFSGANLVIAFLLVFACYFCCWSGLVPIGAFSPVYDLIMICLGVVLAQYRKRSNSKEVLPVHVLEVAYWLAFGASLNISIGFLF
ncbi:hypothetical protein IEQ34_011744 [Dendrobium chrysotoxum]|uniref:Uncharacterized protein n=1 Tax=Dendrobium chrysotoxum TaxID=161865 RepID=A0AAV7GUJ5_DENCH|nr:hypothetical protein IEQ34_011744 [Dendrobium chrysotoxum]